MAGVVALLLACTGCGDPEIEDTGARGADKVACAALVEDLPSMVADQDRRSTTGSPLGGAWGDPPIVLRCGVGKPEDYDPVAGCQTTDGLDWYVPQEATDDQSADVVMTTIGRQPAVEVTLPSEHRPPATAMVDLAPAIKEHTRQTTPCS